MQIILFVDLLCIVKNTKCVIYRSYFLLYKTCATRINNWFCCKISLFVLVAKL